MYAVIDIETTGTSPARAKITEVAIVRHDGNKIVDEYSTLINPECSIPEWIVRLTGINNQMVRDAPKFYKIAREIVERTDGCIFVAHNVRFDYSFLKKEFSDLGYVYQRPTLCTVRLARKLVPKLSSYSLGPLTKHLKIPLTNAHRALGDARATTKLLDHLISIDDKRVEGTIVSHEVSRKVLPPQLEKEKIDNLPESTGVYYFHDGDDRTIYVGKSTNIRKRVVSHLQPDHKSYKPLVFKNNIADIKYEETGSELIALLLESYEIKRLKPEFNRAQRRQHYRLGLYPFNSDKGHLGFRIRGLVASKTPIALIGSNLSGQSVLARIVEEYNLCPKLSTEPSVAKKIDHECCLACLGTEAATIYNTRVKSAIKGFEYRKSDFIIIDRGRNHRESSLIWIAGGIYRGYGYFDSDRCVETIEDIESIVTSYEETPDAKQILLRCLKKKRHPKIINLESTTPPPQQLELADF